MWCSMCPFLATCEDPARDGGGCDCDGSDDFGVNVDGVIALQMGARSLMKRHFDRQRNWARRRERVAEDSKRTTASAEHGQEAQA